LGQPVAQLVSKEMAAGTHTISWDATDLPSGAYFCFLNAGEKSFVNKILLLK
jgi:hypothetical protein